MAEDRNPTPSKPDQTDPARRGPTTPGPTPDQGGEAELTEKEEQKHGGKNKQTPGPIYDV